MKTTWVSVAMAVCSVTAGSGCGGTEPSDDPDGEEEVYDPDAIVFESGEYELAPGQERYLCYTMELPVEGPDGDRDYLLGVGRWIPYKRFDLMIDVAEHVLVGIRELPQALARRIPEPWLYARLDGVDLGGVFTIMEVDGELLTTFSHPRQAPIPRVVSATGERLTLLETYLALQPEGVPDQRLLDDHLLAAERGHVLRGVVRAQEAGGLADGVAAEAGAGAAEVVGAGDREGDGAGELRDRHRVARRAAAVHGVGGVGPVVLAVEVAGAHAKRLAQHFGRQRRPAHAAQQRMGKAGSAQAEAEAEAQFVRDERESRNHGCWSEL